MKFWLWALIPVASLAAPAAADDWYHIATRPTAVTYADADSIEPSELVVTFDVLTSYPEGRGAAGQVFYSADRIEVDCDDNSFRVVLITQLDEAREVVGELNGFDAEWQTIGPGTAAENFRLFACDEALRDSPVNDPFAAASRHWEP